eukprot:SAG11_NODE_11591_length_750_cov_1.675883_1_plen_93_part_00
MISGFSVPACAVRLNRMSEPEPDPEPELAAPGAGVVSEVDNEPEPDQEPASQPAAEAEADFNPEAEYQKLRTACAQLNARISQVQQEHHEHK